MRIAAYFQLFQPFRGKIKLNFEVGGQPMILHRACVKLALPFALVAAALAGAGSDGQPVTVSGYVLDSACAFTKNLSKPISADCAIACAKAGSPLVILTENGAIYWPIADTTPATGQNEKLMKFAGQKVTAKGKVFQRAGSRALVIETVELQSDAK